MPHAQPNPLYYLLPVLLLLPLIIYRMRKMAGTQPLKLRELWVRPLILIVLAGVVIGLNPPQLADVPWLVLAAALGAGAGWLRGPHHGDPHAPRGRHPDDHGQPARDPGAGRVGAHSRG